MKKSIIIALFFAAIRTQAQCPVGFTQVTSFFKGDNICLLKGAKECTPKVTSIRPDTIRSAIYSLSMTRDTTQSLYVMLTAFDRKGNQLALTNPVTFTAPMSGYAHWGLLTGVLDSYISGQLNTLYGIIFH